uniref:NADH:ubiquinone reductase (H(+)-translocating) n=1 Tax=Gnathostoma spinigerum TaxID=75299 RepID=A0A0K0NPA0_9BILA|nr:NADH dehydrogenase subunit 5 [Gnathostoma spinigerum]AKM22099.1 NADH dehydrogenase subunit 5 [Gnathostoma spinigerum]
MIVFSIFLKLFSFFLVVVFLLFLPVTELSLFFLEWDFFCLKFSLYFNSLLFSIVLLLITMSVLIFSSYYLVKDVMFDYYYLVLFIFVMSMFSLIFSSSCLTMLLSWDLLGISSFFLVLFYNNWDSCSGAMNTVLTNRLGDYFLFVFFCGGFFSSYFFGSMMYFVSMFVLMLLWAGFTKSAQFPFSSWLPKAMSAPTPVSSLVHSSTLVTAGLILIMNFGSVLLSYEVMVMICLVGIFTMVFSSFSALFEEDLKKVVALSTLSQMGFCMLTMGLGLVFVSFVHMVSHALFKSCLFMQIGYLIHCSLGQQDGRCYSNLCNVPFFVQLQLMVTLFCLCGLFFTSGAVSKDYILEFMFNNAYSVFFSLLFFVSVFLTFCYSYRLWKGFFMGASLSFNCFSDSLLYSYLSLVLVFLSVSFMWWLSCNLFCVPLLLLYVDFFVPVFYLLFICLVFFFMFKFLLKEAQYKFLVDYMVKLLIVGIKSNKFVDLFLGSLNSKGYDLFLLSGYGGLGFMKSFYYNSLVLVVFILLFLV